MSHIRSANTSPEKEVRSFLYKQGYRFRLHKKDLPGKPDIVLTKYKTVIFVNGCFWHRHKGCKFASTPKSSVAYWCEKFKSTVTRDEKRKTELVVLGWEVLVIWECEINRKIHERKIIDFLKRMNRTNSEKR